VIAAVLILAGAVVVVSVVRAIRAAYETVDQILAEELAPRDDP